MPPIRILISAVAILLFAAAPTLACAVCGGDKNSDMVKGAFSGVVVMVLVTYGVLFGFAAMMVACFVRARRVARGDGRIDGDSTPS